MHRISLVLYKEILDNNLRQSSLILN